MENSYTKEKVSTFQERFKELCDAMSQTDTSIADVLRVSKQTISSWKSGYRSPKRPMVELIAQIFNVNVDWLLGYDFPKNAPYFARYINDGAPVKEELNKSSEQRLARVKLSTPVRVKVPQDLSQGSGVKMVSDTNRTISDKDEKAVKIARFIGQMAKEDPESALEILKIVVDKDML